MHCSKQSINITNVTTSVHCWSFCSSVLNDPEVGFMVFNDTSNKYFSHVMTVSFLGEETGVPRITEKIYHIMLYWVHFAWVGFELTILVAIGTDCSSNYHTIMSMTTPMILILIKIIIITFNLLKAVGRSRRFIDWCLTSSEEVEYDMTMCTFEDTWTIVLIQNVVRYVVLRIPPLVHL